MEALPEAPPERILDLEDLVVHEGERAVVLAGEIHSGNTPYVQYATLELLNAFEPDAIAVELRHCGEEEYALLPFIKSWRRPELRMRGEVTEYGLLAMDLGFSPMSVALSYACLKHLPIYFVDWAPFSPQKVTDILDPGHVLYSYGTMAEQMASTIDTLFGPGSMERIMRLMSDEQLMYSLSLPQIEMEEDEMLAYALWDSLVRTREGMWMRNEWTAQALDSIEAERLFHVGGSAHYKPELSIIPLQELVAGQQRYHICLKEESLRSGNRVRRVLESRSPELPWELLDYFTP